MLEALAIKQKLGRWASGGAMLLVIGCATTPVPSVSVDDTPQATPERAPTTDAGVPPCAAADLAGTARWQGATGSLAGGLSLVNTGSSACALPGNAQLELVDAQGEVLPTTQQQAPDLCQAPQDTAGCPSHTTVVVQSGEHATLRFVWQNWCGEPPVGPIALDVMFPTQPNPLSVPVVDPAGKPSTAAPRCNAPDSPSTLALGPVELL
jgi:Protein of unknown function (DUF4232)